MTIDLVAPAVQLQAPFFTADKTPDVLVNASDSDGYGLAGTVAVDVDLDGDLDMFIKTYLMQKASGTLGAPAPADDEE